MKTAVDFMASELLYLDNEYDMKLINKNEYQAKRKEIIEQAKEMEKEQIINAYWDGYIKPYSQEMITEAEQYYNENYEQD